MATESKKYIYQVLEKRVLRGGKKRASKWGRNRCLQGKSRFWSKHQSEGNLEDIWEFEDNGLQLPEGSVEHFGRVRWGGQIKHLVVNERLRGYRISPENWDSEDLLEDRNSSRKSWGHEATDFSAVLHDEATKKINKCLFNRNVFLGSASERSLALLIIPGEPCSPLPHHFLLWPWWGFSRVSKMPCFLLPQYVHWPKRSLHFPLRNSYSPFTFHSKYDFLFYTNSTVPQHFLTLHEISA